MNKKPKLALRKAVREKFRTKMFKQVLPRKNKLGIKGGLSGDKALAMGLPIAPKHMRVADNILAGDSYMDALNKAGYNISNQSCAASTGLRIMKRKEVQDYMRSQSLNCAGNIVRLANEAKNEGVKLKANQDVLDRTGFKATNVNQNLNVNISISDEEFADIISSFSNR